MRLEVGDKVFFDIVRTFYQEHKAVPATTQEFIATAEKIAGRDLSKVWNVWLYGKTMPAELPLLPATAGK